MAIQCGYCGKDLRDSSSRFCNHCGMLVPSHPLSPQSLLAAKKNSPASLASADAGSEDEKHSLPEQTAFPPVLPPPSDPTPPPSHVEGTDDEQQADKTVIEADARAWRQRRSSEINWPAPQTHVSFSEPVASQVDAEQQPLVASSEGAPAKRPLHVKVWDAENNEQTYDEAIPLKDTVMSPVVAPSSAASSIADSLSDQGETMASMQERVEEKPLVASSPEDIEQMDTVVTPFTGASGDISTDIENIDTMHTPVSMPSAPPQVERTSTPRRSDAPVANSANSANVYVPRETPLPASIPPVQTPESTAPSNSTPPPMRSARLNQRKRSPFIIAVAVLCVLVLIGLAALLLRPQGSQSALTTQPWQHVSNAQLGVALQYPTAWQKQGTGTQMTVADSSHTGQFKVLEFNADAGDGNHVLQQQEKALSMSNVKTQSSLSFAGATWQQVQGTLLQNGASYMGTLLVTQHGQQTIVLEQLAIQTVYSSYETLTFAPMRASLHFL